MSSLRRYRRAAVRALCAGFVLGALVVVIPALLGGGGNVVRSALTLGLIGAGIVATGVVGAGIAVAATAGRPAARRPRRAGAGAAIGISLPGVAVLLVSLARETPEAVWGVLPLTVLAAAVSAVVASSAVDAADSAEREASAAPDLIAGRGEKPATERG